MEIEHVASRLSQLIRLHSQEPISTVTCNTEEFEELWYEAKDSELVDSSDEHWFTLKGASFSIHLSLRE